MLSYRRRYKSHRRDLAWHAANIVNLTMVDDTFDVDDLLGVKKKKPLKWGQIVDLFGPVAKDERDPPPSPDEGDTPTD